MSFSLSIPRPRSVQFPWGKNEENVENLPMQNWERGFKTYPSVSRTCLLNETSYLIKPVKFGTHLYYIHFTFLACDHGHLWVCQNVKWYRSPPLKFPNVSASSKLSIIFLLIHLIVLPFRRCMTLIICCSTLAQTFWRRFRLADRWRCRLWCSTRTCCLNHRETNNNYSPI